MPDCEATVEVQITVQPPKRVRLQVYDDGAGEYFYDKPVSTLIVAGSQIPTGANRVMGPFWLPSPISICKNGLANFQLNNIENNQGSVKAYVMLVFASPKQHREESLEKP